MNIATKLRTRKVKTEVSPTKSGDAALERAKNIATIVSAIAIPLILALVGYFVQRELSTEGLRKDYVGIAAGILKEDPTRQEPELRIWAVKVLDENSPVPFSKKARDGLLAGAPVVVPGSAWLPPPSDCRKSPPARSISKALQKLSRDAKKLDERQLLLRMQDFVDIVVREEGPTLEALSRLQCLQQWVSLEEQNDIDYRKSIGAPSSKSVYEQIERERAASAAGVSVPAAKNSSPAASMK